MLNCITIMGRLTRDPERKQTSSELSPVTFTVAVGRDRKEEVDFIDCEAWRQTADFVEKHFTKGRQIVVSGRLTIKNWTTRDGNKRRSAVVVAENCYFGDSKRDGDGGSTGSYDGNSYGGYEESMAQVSKYSGVQQDFNYPYPNQAPASDFALLEDDDGQLPF